MSGAEDEPFDEFDFIARVLRPLTVGAPEARGLFDDAAVIPPFPGKELVVSTDAMVEGVHFLPSDSPDLVARKLLRANLSDLAAKGADPYGYFLNVSWPHGYPVADRRAFVAGLAADQAEFELLLFGGDTTSTPGPLTATITILGKCGVGESVSRMGAAPGDRVLVSGTIGDGWLGLQAARGELRGLAPGHADWLADRYRLPQPRLKLGRALSDHAAAAADVSDGLIADAGRIAEASDVGVRIDLECLPVSAAAADWLASQLGRDGALADLATGGDDYEVVCAATPERAEALIAEGRRHGVPLTDVGEFTVGRGIDVRSHGAPVPIASAGWKHG